jgi:hypothetical protein
MTRKYNFFHALIFVLPFLGWFYNIGLNLSMFQIIIFIIIFFNIISITLGKEKNLLHIKNNYINIFIFYSIFITMFMSNFIIEDFQQLGGFFRSEGRYLSQIILWLLYFSLIPIAYNYIKTLNDIYFYFKIYLQALILLLILGWIQFVIYKFTGTDIFPIDFYDDGRARTGIWTYMGSGIFRISSLGGEPKGFAQSLIIGFFIIHIFNKMNISFFKFDLLLKIIIVITIFMTLSTSGFVLFFILFFIYYIYLFFLGEVKIKLNLKKTIILIGIMFSAVYLVNTNINFFSSVLNERVLDRNIASEDYDQPIQDFLMAKSEYSIFGVGEISRIQELVKSLKENNFENVGKLMTSTHYGLSKDYEVSCEELDFLVDNVLLEEGVLGARVMGGGFGGCTINLLKKSEVEKIIEKLSKAYLEKFEIELTPYQVSISEGTHFTD